MTDFTPDQQRKLDALLAPKRSIEITNMANVKPRKAYFLWYPYFPLGQVVIVAGAPGHGKSQFSALAGAMASRGALPGDVKEPSRVLMLCAEDDLATTVAPRLLAVNGDLRMIDSINVRTEYPNGLTSTGMIKLPTDHAPIHEWAREHADARLVVMDPVASFFDRSHSTLVNQDVRDAFDPMVAIAQTYGITIVIVLHLNKSESREFATRIAESHGFQALARSVLALGPDPDDPMGTRGSQKIIAVTKANLIKPGTYGMRCEVRSATLRQFTPPIETSELVLLGKCEITADDLLIPAGERESRNGAAEWLAELVADDGWIKTEVLRKAAISDGWSWRMLERVRKARGYQSAKQQGIQNGPWWVGGPRADVREIGKTADSRDNQSGGLADLGGLRDAEDRQDHQDRPTGGPEKPADLNGRGGLDEFRKWEQRRLGEGDDDDDE